ncbi:SdiA-regulated domain-containing protein [Qipengyuania sp.]|uniref:SdiA-regulated domain-containing protein n=1 Tax=Qipengyuania sp. TaxID=2004515 RepID=UPI0035C817D8
MKIFLRAGAAALALLAAPASAAGLLDNYAFGFIKPIDTKEASAVAFNWDTRRLLVTTDEEESDGRTIFGEYDLNGDKTATVVLGGCLSLGAAQCDPEGLTYVGGGNYVVAEERYQDIALIRDIGGTGTDRTYTAYDDAPTISIGGDAGNSGLEGIAYDRLTGDYFGVKERQPMVVYKGTGADFGNETATTSVLFDASGLGLDRLSDIAVLSNGAFAAAPFGDNLLLLSGRSFRLVEVTKAGALVGSYDLSAYKSIIDPANEGGKFEGLTMDDRGNLYLVSDDGDGPNQSFMLKLQYNGAVPEPGTWMMLIAGFGAVGGAMRSRRKPALALR